MPKKLNKSPEQWFTHFDEGPTTPFPCWKIKVKNDIQSPVGVLPVGGTKGKLIQGRRARLIVRLANRHFRAQFEAKRIPQLKVTTFFQLLMDLINSDNTTKNQINKFLRADEQHIYIAPVECIATLQRFEQLRQADLTLSLKDIRDQLAFQNYWKGTSRKRFSNGVQHCWVIDATICKALAKLISS